MKKKNCSPLFLFSFFCFLPPPNYLSYSVSFFSFFLFCVSACVCFCVNACVSFPTIKKSIRGSGGRGLKKKRKRRSNKFSFPFFFSTLEFQLRSFFRATRMPPIAHPPAFYAKVAGICFVVRMCFKFRKDRKDDEREREQRRERGVE